MDYNSSKNQKIKGKFIEQNVLCNVGPEVEFILDVSEYGVAHKEPPYMWDDVDNLYVIDREQLFDDMTEENEDYHDALDEFEYPHNIKLSDLDTEELIEIAEYMGFEKEDYEQIQEPLEWWKVSSWLGEKLYDHGEPVIQYGGGFPWIWGRCCSGQAILLDYVISQICSDMGILEGQINEWKI